MIDGFEFFSAARIILDHHFQRAQHGHAAERMAIEVIAHRMVEHRDIDDAVRFGHANSAHEFANGFRRHAAAAQTGKCRHAWIVPAINNAAAHQLCQHAL